MGNCFGSRIWKDLSRRLLTASRCHIAIIIVVVALVACVSPLAVFLYDYYSDGESDGGVTEDPVPLDPTWYITRKQWLASKPTKETLLSGPQKRVVIAHTATGECHNRDTCSTIVRSIQQAHMAMQGFDDIAYNFVVGGDGRVYEGRGWGVKGEHTRTCNTNCLGVAFIGDYRRKGYDSKPTPDQIKYLQRLLDIGERNASLIESYKIIPQCQAEVTESPGDNLFKVMVTWPRYSATDGDFHLVCHWN